MHQLLVTWQLTCLRIWRRRRRWKKQLLMTCLTCSQNVSSASMNTLRSCTTVAGLMMSLPMDRLRSTPASCCKRPRVPSQMTSVLPSFNRSRRDAHQSLMAATHHSTVFSTSCTSGTGADANSCLSAKMWYWTWCALKMMATCEIFVFKKSPCRRSN